MPAIILGPKTELYKTKKGFCPHGSDSPVREIRNQIFYEQYEAMITTGRSTWLKEKSMSRVINTVSPNK